MMSGRDDRGVDRDPARPRGSVLRGGVATAVGVVGVVLLVLVLIAISG